MVLTSPGPHRQHGEVPVLTRLGEGHVSPSTRLLQSIFPGSGC